MNTLNTWTAREGYQIDRRQLKNTSPYATDEKQILSYENLVCFLFGRRVRHFDRGWELAGVAGARRNRYLFRTILAAEMEHERKRALARSAAGTR